MLDVVGAYNKYLQNEQKIKTAERQVQSDGRFSASSAGMCVKKLWFAKNHFPKSEIDDKTMRLFKLGTLIGEDIEKSMKYLNDKNVYVYTEEYLKDEDLNIGGSFDLLVVDSDTRKGYLYDYKTCSSYKWRTMFGHLKNRDPNPANNYEFQLGTYAMMLNKSKEYCDEVVEMKLIYYNKDNSLTKEKKVDLQYIDFAQKYWEKAKFIAESDQSPDNQQMVPYYQWECNVKYCPYSDSCNSAYKK
tara:strand:+ start:1042 stop:1773 length:732 start_codon:yes stop_codon:yes gene_type:complete